MRNSYSIRSIVKKDAALIQSLAQKCSPLEIHTEYTYWVCVNLFQDCSFVLECNDEPIGYIMAIENADAVFIWQIGITEPFQGKGLAKKLIDACVDTARRKKKNLGLTISRDNQASYHAFYNYCLVNELEFVCNGEASILDAQGNIYETELYYSIICIQ